MEEKYFNGPSYAPSTHDAYGYRLDLKAPWRDGRGNDIYPKDAPTENCCSPPVRLLTASELIKMRISEYEQKIHGLRALLGQLPPQMDRAADEALHAIIMSSR